MKKKPRTNRRTNVCINSIYVQTFLCFLVREMMNSRALDADPEVCTKEEGGPPLAPPPPLYGTPLWRWEQQNNGKSTAQPPGRRTFYAVLSVGGVKRSSLASSSVLCPSFLPSLLTSVSRLVMSLLPPCCGVPTFSSVPVDTVLMSLFSWQHHQRRP